MAHVENTRNMKNVFRMLVKMSEGKRLLERHRHIFKDDIEIDLIEIIFDLLTWLWTGFNSRLS